MKNNKASDRNLNTILYTERPAYAVSNEPAESLNNKAESKKNIVKIWNARRPRLICTVTI